jgi:hypothetical protein
VIIVALWKRACALLCPIELRWMARWDQDVAFASTWPRMPQSPLRGGPGVKGQSCTKITLEKPTCYSFAKPKSQVFAMQSR